MRFAERRHQIDRLDRRSYTTALKRAELTTTTGTNEELLFASGLSVICGGNGAGKSTILGAIWNCLSGNDLNAKRLNVPPWLRSVRLEGIHSGVDWTASLEMSSGGYSGQCPASVYHVDPAAETEDVLRQFRVDMQPDDLLEGVDPAAVEEKYVKVLSYILRRDYAEILVYEVTAFSEDDDPVPYFEVESMGKRYSLQQMGRGELSAIYLLWRLISMPPGSIILIEEPETHLATFSQELMIDALVARVIDRDLCVVASSHSPGFFQRLPGSHISLVSSLPTPSVRGGLATEQISRHLGAGPSISAIVLVEDNVAAELLRALLAQVDGDLLRRIDIRSVASGESGILRIVEDVSPATGRAVPILGLLDGDQRRGATGDRIDGIGYLIGESAPEVILQRRLARWRSGDLDDWTPFLPGGAGALRMALERLDGRDPHDWLHELSREFGGVRAVIGVLVELLLKDEPTMSEAQALIDWIRSSGGIV